jgi:hypothetical protein
MSNSDFDNMSGGLLLTILAVLLLGWLAAWAGKSYMEATSYENVTGRQVSTWDAMWLELRVTP